MNLSKIFSVIFLFSFSIYSQSEKSSTTDLLSAASLITVTVGGNFPLTGSYSASAVERVDQFVTRLYNQAYNLALGNSPTEERISNVQKEFEKYSLRNILLKRRSGEQIKIDLLKFRKTGNYDLNPYLKNDDILIFPSTDIERNFISIYGAVNKEGRFHFFNGDKLSDALFLADGINPAYEDVSKVEVTRLSYDGNTMENLIVNIDSNIELKRGDRIRVLANETQRKDFKVLVIGEFNMTGFIPIKKEHTSLRELIERVGGFTEHADLQNTQILRGVNVFKYLAFSEEIEQLLMLRMSTLISEDSIYFKIDEKLRFLRGNANIDITKINDVTDTLFILKDGDIIYAPTKVELVYVYGQVNEPGYIKYESGKDYTHYLRKAGGLGETASGDVYIIKGKTRTWISAEELYHKNLEIEPGDYIWASKQPVRTFWDHIDRASRVASVVGGIATVILLFFQATK